MHNVTLVVPVYKLHSYRLRNFKNMIQRVLELKCNVIVGEQLTDLQSSGLTMLNKLNVKHEVFDIKCDKFCKSELLNKLTELVETEYIWFMDCDYIFDMHVSIHEYNKYDFYQPFNKCIDLNDVQTQQITTGKLESSMFHIYENRTIDIICSVSYICKKSSLKAIGGYDEKYKGWGLEDIDLAARVLNTPSFKVGKNNRITALHQWHPVSTKSRNQGATNLKIFKNKGFTTTKVIEMYKNRVKNTETIDLY